MEIYEINKGGKIMGKFKLLLDVVDDIRHLANSLEELGRVIKYNEGGEILEDNRVEGDKEVGNDKIVTENKVEEIVVEKDKEVNDVEIYLEDVRGVLANKSQEGFSDEIRSIIKEYNCEKLSEINPKYYLEILQKAKQLVDK